MPEQDIINSMQQYFKNNQPLVQKSWDLAKEKAKEMYPETDPSYYPYVVSLTKDYVSQQSDQDFMTNDEENKESLFREPPQGSNLNPKPSGVVTEAIKDLEYFDWKQKSTEMFASSRFLIGEALYQMDFNFIMKGSPQWLYDWNPLLKQGITKIVFVSIDQLNGDLSKQQISANKLDYKEQPQLMKAMNLAFKEYFLNYNKRKDVQYIIFSTETQSRLQFLNKYITEFLKAFTSFCLVKEVGNSIVKGNIKYLALKNNKASLTEEGEGGESGSEGTVTSDAFDSAPFDAKRKKKDWQKDWDQQKERTKFKIKRLIDSSLID